MNFAIDIYSPVNVGNAVPTSIKNVQIAAIYKWKGDQQISRNYQRISILSITRKILVRLLLKRFQKNASEFFLKTGIYD